MRRPLIAGLAAYVLVAIAFTAGIAVPFVQKKRDIPAAVPSPPPLNFTDLDVVRGGGRVCMTDVAMSAESEQLRFKLGTYHHKGPPLEVTVRGAGYAAARSIPRGYADNATLSVPLPRAGRSRLVTVCIRNSGDSKVALYAAADRAESRVHVFVDGKPVAATPTLSFNERGDVSIADRAGVIAGRIAVFRGLLDHGWIVWLLALLVLVVVPVLVGASLALAYARLEQR
ncbi:MAG: hypothetical protein QOH13_1898 [Thermoleophilaceae bacterium]|nr:hypothetical protein [Thermoleophilaceae bacterium]